MIGVNNMLYCGAYKVSNYKNLNSIPDIQKKEKIKNNGIAFVISDTLFTNNNNEISQDFFFYAKKFIDRLGRQIRVFDNVEAIVLNGNIFKGLYSKNNSQTLDPSMWCHSFLKAIGLNANLVSERHVPIYYVRGDEDCYISSANLTSDLRGIIKICNGVIIGNTLFVHGHNNLPFKERLETDFTPTSLSSRTQQEEIANEIYKQTGYKVVMSNTVLKSYESEHFISSGCFEKNRETVVTF